MKSKALGQSFQMKRQQMRLLCCTRDFNFFGMKLTRNEKMKNRAGESQSSSPIDGIEQGGEAVSRKVLDVSGIKGLDTSPKV